MNNSNCNPNPNPTHSHVPNLTHRRGIPYVTNSRCEVWCKNRGEPHGFRYEQGYGLDS